MKTLQPPGWPRARGYSNGIAARGTVISVAGQIGWNERSEFDSDDLVMQVRQALSNVLAVLAEANAGPQHIVRMTWYLLSRDEYVSRAHEIGAVYREVMSRDGAVHYPAMTAVQITALIEARAKVEIEVTAIVPD
ncbi:MAG: RidA family protein [Burkholderiaceae bacterium]